MKNSQLPWAEHEIIGHVSGHDHASIGPSGGGRSQISFGDVSSWARGTVKARRPEVATPRRVFVPVRNLANIRPVVAESSASVPTFGCFVPDAKDRPDEPDVEVTLAICDRLNRLLMPHLFR